MAEIRVRTLVIILMAVFGPLLIWFLLDLAIETDSERIGAMCEQMAIATEAGDPTGMVQFIADDYSFEGLTRDDLRSLAERYFQVYGDTDAVISSSNVSVQGTLATAEVVVSIRASSGDLANTRFPTRWRLTFRLGDEEVTSPEGPKMTRVWQIVRVQPVAVGRMSVEDWQSITRHLGWSERRPMGPRGTPSAE